MSIHDESTTQTPKHGRLEQSRDSNTTFSEDCGPSHKSSVDSLRIMKEVSRIEQRIRH